MDIGGLADSRACGFPNGRTAGAVHGSAGWMNNYLQNLMNIDSCRRMMNIDEYWQTRRLADFRVPGHVDGGNRPRLRRIDGY